MYVCVYMYVCESMCMFVYVCECICVCLCVCMCMCVQVYVCVSMCIEHIVHGSSWKPEKSIGPLELKLQATLPVPPGLGAGKEP